MVFRGEPNEQPAAAEGGSNCYLDLWRKGPCGGCVAAAEDAAKNRGKGESAESPKTEDTTPKTASLLETDQCQVPCGVWFTLFALVCFGLLLAIRVNPGSGAKKGENERLAAWLNGEDYASREEDQEKTVNQV